MKYVILATMMAAGATAQAQDVNSLVLSWMEDTEKSVARETTIPLGQVKSMTFNADDGSVTLQTVSGTLYAMAEEQAWKGTFACVDGIGATLSQPCDSYAEVWTVSGTLLLKAEEESALRLTSLPHGVYIIRSRGTARKVTL